MKPDTLAGIQAAVDYNPDRSRVTLPRQAVRDLIASHASATHDRERLRSCAIKAEGAMTELCRRNDALASEIAETAADRDRAAQAARHLREKATTPKPQTYDVAWILPRAWMLYALSAFGGYLAHG